MDLEADRAGHDLVGPVRGTALAVLVATAALLALALTGELLRHRPGGRRVVAVADHVVPASLRAGAVSLLALLSSLAPARALAADGSVRDWLERPTGTTTPAAVVTPDALDDLVPPATALADGPFVVLPDEPAPPRVPPGPPPAPGPEGEPARMHVVTPGECLWSIAAGFLPPGSDDRAVDLTWRAIYEINRGAVGGDPALIHPGLVLRLPPPPPSE
jgi:nucleoid-associated protein YgaU